MNTKATSLQAKILAINTSNKNSEIFLNYEIEQLSKFIGQNILKIDGSFKAKINHVRHEEIKNKINAFGFSWVENSHYWFTANYKRLTLNIKTCITGGGQDQNGVNKHCIYENKQIDLFIIDDNGNLQPLEKQWFENIQFNEADILEAKNKIKAAAEQYNKILALMPYEFRSVTDCERLTR